MNLVAIVIGLTLLSLSLLFVTKPFQAASGKKNAVSMPPIRPEEHRLAALTALRDLDFDYQVGKVSQEDYTGLRPRLVAEAARFLQDDKNDEIEAMIQARKASLAKTLACNHCGARVEAGSRFCPHCGKTVGEACPSCGKVLKEGDQFCSSCGVQLTIQAGTAA